MARNFEVGNVVSLHFDSPSAIGYNGLLCEIRLAPKDGPYKGKYYCESIFGTAACWAREHEMTFEAEKWVEPYHGTQIIEIGD